MSTSPDVMDTDEPIQGVEEDEFEDQSLREELQGEESDGEVEEEGEEDEEDEEEKEDEEDKEETAPGGNEPTAESVPTRRKREKKGNVPLTREAGKSFLPFSRVQKIIKADKDIPIVARDAVFLISLATESFIQELAAAAQRVADKERRMTVQHKDIATVVRKADEFMFLEDLIPWLSPEPEKKRGKPTFKDGAEKKSNAPTLHEHFSISKKQTAGVDVIMNEDGTMAAAGEESDD